MSKTRRGGLRPAKMLGKCHGIVRHRPQAIAVPAESVIRKQGIILSSTYICARNRTARTSHFKHRAPIHDNETPNIELPAQQAVRSKTQATKKRKQAPGQAPRVAVYKYETNVTTGIAYWLR